MVNLITCDSYFELFPTLAKIIKNTAGDIKKRNIIFSEAKVSLMVERHVCSAVGGSFSTDVFSFGKYLLKRKAFSRVLSKEGSAMAIKRIISNIPLKCLKSSSRTLAPSLYDLIIQLKSAKISPEDILFGAEQTQKSVLQNKLFDIAEIYREYENFLDASFADDQSSVLSYLPQAIESDDDIKSANVFVIGYSGWTAQARAGIKALVENARSFTAILTEGDNTQAFVNETADFIRQLAKETNQPITEKRINSDYTECGKIIVDRLFTPTKKEPIKTDKVYSLLARTPYQETMQVAGIIKEKVLSGECRYKDFSVAIPEDSYYGELLSDAFTALDIPYFLDEKKKPTSHPLVTLIISYIDAKRKGLERKTLSAFYKNPLFCADKAFADNFENYCIKYNVNYMNIFSSLAFETDGENYARFEEFRLKIVRSFENFNVEKLLEDLSVEQKLQDLTETLKSFGEIETSAENDQIYAAVTGILTEIKEYLGGVELSLGEYKSLFLSGVNALELSIIPQFNDAVFVGGYKEIALVKGGYLFAVGLTDAVPAIRQDVALLSDGDIEILEEIKVKVEPKINVVNHRTRECVALALGAFSRGLFISMPIAGIDGKEKAKGEVFTSISSAFTVKPFPTVDGYLTESQGRKSFARAIGLFADNNINNVDSATAYYKAVGESKLSRLLDNANRDIKVKLENRNVEFKETAPTTVEEYFKCPYRTFLSKTLRLEPRKQGALDALSTGTLFHELLREYAIKINRVIDRESSDKLFDEIKEKVINRSEFKRYYADAVQKSTVERVFFECKNYCYRTFLSLKTSQFKVAKTEARFGSDERAVYPAISLNDGKIKLKGSIDRVDESERFFRILDYKTGDFSSDESSLFYGNSLQLYLYALAVLGDAKDKTPAGLFYLPISGGYSDGGLSTPPMADGKTVDDEQAILAQDLNVKENKRSEFLPVKYSVKNDAFTNAIKESDLLGYIDYAYRVSDLAAKRLCEGVIVPSPMENACKYCDYKGMCDGEFAIIRTKNTVDENTIIQAVKGERDGETN